MKRGKIDYNKSLDDVLEELMIEYGNAIIKFIYSYVKDKQLAEDFTQDVFIKAYKNLNEFKGEASVKTWLYKIAANQCKDYFRSWHYKKVRVNHFLVNYLNSSDHTPEQHLVNKALSKDLSKAIFSLPLKYREIVILFYYEEMSLKEISEVFNLNINTVKSRIAKSKTLLRQVILHKDWREV